MNKKLRIFEYINYDNELEGFQYILLNNGKKDYNLKPYVERFNEYRGYLREIINTSTYISPLVNPVNYNTDKIYNYKKLIQYQRDSITEYIEHYLYYIKEIIFKDFTFRLKNGKVHSLDSPAIVASENTTIPVEEAYYIDDIEYSYKEWLVRVRKYKLEKIISNIN